MKEERDEIVNQFASIHETEIKDEDFMLTYDPGMVFEKDGRNKIDNLILSHVSTSGSAICSGKYTGHGFGLRSSEECEWVIKKHIDWNQNVSHILIPVRKGVVAHPDDPEKIEYRMMLQKILRVENPKIEDIKTHIGYLLNRYPQK